MCKSIQWSSAVAVAAIACAGFTAIDRWTATPVAAFQEVENKPNPNDFGMFTVMPDDSIRVGVANSSIGLVPPGPCRVQISIYRADGTLVRQDWHIVEPGRGASSDVRGFEIDPGGPVQAWAHVALAKNRDGDPSCIASLEVFDRMGRRNLFNQSSFRMGAEPHLQPPTGNVQR
jgi:hypothetical protein